MVVVMLSVLVLLWYVLHRISSDLRRASCDNRHCFHISLLSLFLIPTLS